MYAAKYSFLGVFINTLLFRRTSLVTSALSSSDEDALINTTSSSDKQDASALHLSSLSATTGLSLFSTSMSIDSAELFAESSC